MPSNKMKGSTSHAEGTKIPGCVLDCSRFLNNSMTLGRYLDQWIHIITKILKTLISFFAMFNSLKRHLDIHLTFNEPFQPISKLMDESFACKKPPRSHSFHVETDWSGDKLDIKSDFQENNTI